MKFSACGALACALLASTSGFSADNYPNRPVRMIVAFPPGGGADILGRQIGQKLSETWNQQVVIDNRPGGAANIGAELAAKSPPDGYTIFEFTLAHSVNPSLFPKLGYDPLKDFDPVLFMATVPNVLAVHPSVPAQTTMQFIDYVKQRPGQVNYASTGNGGPQHLAMELFKTLAGVQLTHVPYKGAAPALTDLLGGQVQCMFGNMLSTLPHVRGNKLRGLAVSTAARSQALPNVPTVAESGVPGFESGSWYGLVVPVKTPPAIIAHLNKEVNRIINLPDVREKLAADGTQFTGGTSQEFGNYLKSEIAKWAKVVKFAQMKVD